MPDEPRIAERVRLALDGEDLPDPLQEPEAIRLMTDRCLIHIDTYWYVWYGKLREITALIRRGSIQNIWTVWQIK